MGSSSRSPHHRITPHRRKAAMAPPTHLLYLHILLLLLLTPSFSDDATTFIYAGCSQSKYLPSSPSIFNLNSLLASIANAASFSPFANFTSSLSPSSPPVYGLFQCRGDLPVPTCESCVRSAINQLSLLCPSSSGASLQLKGCLVRYDNATFLGLPDRTLLFKKCGGSPVGSDPGARDAVLSAISSGQGLYRVGRSGAVEGSAQCVGDQSARQCGECVAEAVEGVKALCTGAAAGEVYLGKCYIEYYPRGAPEAATRFHAKDRGKNVAIIVGIAVAVLFLVLLLYFLRKTTGGKG